MHKIKVFLASPMSGFQDQLIYTSYRESVLTLINALSDRYEVCSEIQHVTTAESYDSPEKSLREDFHAIEDADIFLLLHPLRMQTSTLIELGYACALKKTLLIVGEYKDLPYMVLGLKKPDYNVAFIQSSIISDKTISNILNSLDLLSNSK